MLAARKNVPGGSDGSTAGATRSGWNPPDILSALTRLRLKAPGAEAPKDAVSGRDQDTKRGASNSAGTPDSPSNCPGLTQVAGVISALAGQTLGGLLTHPGHATLGVYYLAQKHALEAAADHIDGTAAGDAVLVAELLRWVDVSDSVYPDRYAELVEQQGVVAEKDILFMNKEIHKLQPGFYLARDQPSKQLLWVLRGTHDLHDLLTDMAGVATPLPGPKGGFAHWGMWQAAAWLLAEHVDRVADALASLPGYNLLIVGHSMGAGVAALLTQQLNSVPELVAKLHGRKVKGLGVATAACMSGELAAEVAPTFTTLVLRHDLVPRFSSNYVAGLTQELMELDYKSLLVEDVQENPLYQKATDAAAAAKDSVLRTRAGQTAAAKAQAAAAALTPHLAAGAAQARAAAGALLGKAQAALAARKGSQKEVAPDAATPAAAPSGPPPSAGTVAVGEERLAAKQADAAGQLSDVALYAPGRLLYLRPQDDSEQHQFELLEGKPGVRFQRIVLAPTCLSDHFPAAYKSALLTVQASLDSSNGKPAVAAKPAPASTAADTPEQPRDVLAYTSA